MHMHMSMFIYQIYIGNYIKLVMTFITLWWFALFMFVLVFNIFHVFACDICDDVGCFLVDLHWYSSFLWCFLLIVIFCSLIHLFHDVHLFPSIWGWGAWGGPKAGPRKEAEGFLKILKKQKTYVIMHFVMACFSPLKALLGPCWCQKSIQRPLFVHIKIDGLIVFWCYLIVFSC